MRQLKLMYELFYKISPRSYHTVSYRQLIHFAAETCFFEHELHLTVRKICNFFTSCIFQSELIFYYNYTLIDVAAYWKMVLMRDDRL
jgi:hypothetical protein